MDYIFKNYLCMNIKPVTYVGISVSVCHISFIKSDLLHPIQKYIYKSNLLQYKYFGTTYVFTRKTVVSSLAWSLYVDGDSTYYYEQNFDDFVTKIIVQVHLKPRPRL